MLSVLREQAPQTQIVHHILDLLDTILDAIAALAQNIILQVQNLETSMHVLDELCDPQRTTMVAEGDAVAC